MIQDGAHRKRRQLSALPVLYEKGLLSGGAAYVILVIVLRVVTYDDCMLLPKGEKIAKLLRIR